jgi:hypothetical protein
LLFRRSVLPAKLVSRKASTHAHASSTESEGARYAKPYAQLRVFDVRSQAGIDFLVLKYVESPDYC